MGEDPFAKADEGTNYAQPAIFCASLAGWESLGRPDGDFMAGHSLGELAALVAAGALEERDGLELVALRGQPDAGVRRDRRATAACWRCSARAPRIMPPSSPTAHGLSVANDNSPQQVVLSGARDALPGAAAAAEELGLRAIELPVSGAFHSPMMADGRARVRDRRSSTVKISARRASTVLSAVTAAPFDDVRRPAHRRR